MLRENETLLKESARLKNEKQSLLKNKDLADGQVMALTKSLESLQKDIKEKDILVISQITIYLDELLFMYNIHD